MFTIKNFGPFAVLYVDGIEVGRLSYREFFDPKNGDEKIKIDFRPDNGFILDRLDKFGVSYVK